MAEDNPTAQQLSDFKATLVMAYWVSHFTHDTLDDELALFDPTQIGIGESVEEKLMLFLVQSPLPTFIKTGTFKTTGDSILFDNLNTPDVAESKQMIGAQAPSRPSRGSRGVWDRTPRNGPGETCTPSRCTSS